MLHIRISVFPVQVTIFFALLAVGFAESGTLFGHIKSNPEQYYALAVYRSPVKSTNQDRVTESTSYISIEFYYLTLLQVSDDPVLFLQFAELLNKRNDSKFLDDVGRLIKNPEHLEFFVEHFKLNGFQDYVFDDDLHDEALKRLWELGESHQSLILDLMENDPGILNKHADKLPTLPASLFYWVNQRNQQSRWIEFLYKRFLHDIGLSELGNNQNNRGHHKSDAKKRRED